MIPPTRALCTASRATRQPDHAVTPAGLLFFQPADNPRADDPDPYQSVASLIPPRIEASAAYLLAQALPRSHQFQYVAHRIFSKPVQFVAVLNMAWERLANVPKRNWQEA